MSGASSSPAGWWSLLEPASAELFYRRGDPEDPRLGDVTDRWVGGPIEVRAGQPVLIGFPCDEGVRRNGGRPGAAEAPDAIRRQLYRFTSWDGPTEIDLAGLALLDLGNVRVDIDLERAQERLGEILGQLLKSGAVPVVLGGGHETAFGHYLGYVQAGLECAILNIDAHLDVRPYPQGGHSGSPFRQAMEHPTMPVGRGRYSVIGAQRQSVARAHWDFVRAHEGRVLWLNADSSTELVKDLFAKELARLRQACPNIMVTVDADAFRQADVPGCSAPSPIGLDGSVWSQIASEAGWHQQVRSVELVEVNPRLDRDDQTTRWAALGLRQFLVGLARRGAR